MESAPAPIPSTSTARVTIPDTPRPSVDVRDSRFCFHFAKYETCVYIVGIFGIIAAVGRIVVISLSINRLHKEYPGKSTYYFCAIGIIMCAIVLLWEIPLMYFVKKRKLQGLQHFMFASLMIFLGSCLGSIITGAVYKSPGMVLSLSYVLDLIRTPAQMLFVHKFIKTEKLDEDSHLIAAYYKKF